MRSLIPLRAPRASRLPERRFWHDESDLDNKLRLWRDRLDPRNWKKIWRDPAGSASCCTCGAAAASSSISGIQNACCPGVGLPSTLHLTLSANGNCDALTSGQTIALINNKAGDPFSWSNADTRHNPPGFGWIGPLTGSICYVNYTFTCTSGLAGATGCAHWTLSVSILDTLGPPPCVCSFACYGCMSPANFPACQGVSYPAACAYSQTSCSCSPFNVVFTYGQLPNPAPNCATTHGIACPAHTATVTF